MHNTQFDLGVIQAILARFETQRLPRLLSLEKEVDAAQLLNDYEIDFLKAAIIDTRMALCIIERNQEYLPLFTKVITLYIDITTKDLLLEKSK